MLGDLQEASSHFARRLEEASAVLGEDLGTLVNEGPVERLNQTEMTQPALLCMSIALYEYFLDEGGSTPDAVAGHSLGEYSALTAARVIEFADAIKLVHERGKIMQRAVPEGSGSMAAVLGMSLQDIEAVCSEVDEVVAPANINTPTQIVIAGTTNGVALTSERLLEQGARRVVPLAVSVPSHCELMDSTVDEVSELLDSIDLQHSTIPVYQNADGKPYQAVEAIRNNLISQLSSPVRWAQSFQNMIQDGCDTFYECGPGRVLAGLARQIDRSVQVTSLGTLTNFQAALE